MIVSAIDSRAMKWAVWAEATTCISNSTGRMNWKRFIRCDLRGPSDDTSIPRRSLFAIGREIIPQLFEDGGVNDPPISLRRVFLRVKHQRDSSAVRAECARVEDVEALGDRV